jgi:sec-independent protein translocase protein TatC
MMKFLPRRKTGGSDGGEGRPGSSAEMSLVDHLTELRTRLIKSIVAVVLGAIVVFIFAGPIFDFLSEPYCNLRPVDDCVFLATGPLDQFSVQLTLSGYGGLILALPVILYQIGRFVLPGLYPHEKKVLLPFFVVSILLLALGMTVAYLFLPRALEVLGEFLGGDRFESFFNAKEYLGFFTKMLLAFGLAFELPLVLVFLQLVGLVQTKTLRSNRRIACVAVVILGAVITPTGDPFTLLVISLPMYLFYEISLIVGGRMTKNRLDVS